MVKDSAQNKKTRCSPRLRRDHESNSSTTEESAALLTDGRTKSTKRKASPDSLTTTRKKIRGFESEPQNRPQDLRVRVLNRAAREFGEEPKKRKAKRRLEPHQVDNDSASCSTDPGEGCSSERSGKRKAADEGEGPSGKRRRTPDLKDTNQETNQQTKQQTEQTTKQQTKQTTKQQTKQTTKQQTKQQTEQTTKQQTEQTTKQQTEQTTKQQTEQTTKQQTEQMTKQQTEQQTEQTTKQATKQDVPLDPRAEFEAKYEQQDQLGEGGCGSVFAGCRKADHLPVAIKRVPKGKVPCKHVDNNGTELSVEVAIMLKLASGTTGSVGTSAPVSLLDWYDLDEELILVMERPVPCKDLFRHIIDNGGPLQQEEAKLIMKQLVDAAKELQDQQIFHRDIKLENILIETSSDVPRVRLIDFGLGCFTTERLFFTNFYGTFAHTPPEWYSYHTYMAGPTTVWQLGVVLFELLHKRAQFETTKFMADELKISKKLPEDCQDFLRMCLAKVPKHRPTLVELQHHPWLR